MDDLTLLNSFGSWISNITFSVLSGPIFLSYFKEHTYFVSNMIKVPYYIISITTRSMSL